MATYKVIQDIEAEDKFLGPLTLKQFIFGAAGAFFVYLSFFAVTKGAIFLLAVFLPPALLGFFLAIPWSSEQSTEVWVLAKLRFRLKPNARIWDQAGLEELVTITAPKKIEKQLTNGLDATEVESRLKALASTLDTRGWAVKNSTLPGNYVPPGMQTDDRLLSISTLPQDIPDADANQYEDMLDTNTFVSDNLEHMIQESSAQRMQQSLEKMERIRRGEPLEAVQQPEVNFAPPTAVDATFDEAALADQLRAKKAARDLASSHMQRMPVFPVNGGPLQTTQPAAQTPPIDPAVPPAQEPVEPVTNTPDPAILNLAQNNDFSIDTIARQAKRKDAGEDEVVISLR